MRQSAEAAVDSAAEDAVGAGVGTSTSAPILACDGIGMSFGDTKALEDVSLAFEAGRVHALIGQNGAGKTTLGRVLSGSVAPLEGRVVLEGAPLPAGNVHEARARGIEMVHQSFALPPSFTVAEALELFSKRSRRQPFFRRSSLEQEWLEELRRGGIEARPSARIRDLPVETLQALEITRALVGESKVLILDEPTAVLTPHLTELLFERLRQLKQGGVTILIVLHKLREVDGVADTVSVLRGGRLVLGTTPLDATDHGMLSNLIVGAEVEVDRSPPPPLPPTAGAAKANVLELSAVSTKRTTGRVALSEVAFGVRQGEIVGIAGIEGNGQRELVDIIMGLQRPAEGRVRLGDEDVTATSTAERRAHGVRAVPFDRNTEGVSATTSLWENVAILSLISRRFRSAREPVSRRRMRASAREALDRWAVRYRSVNQAAGELSGGNVQRVILARELDDGLRFLVAAQPCRGLDIGATQFVRETLRELRSADAAILLVSSDLDELRELSDRILVMYDGHVTAEFEPPFELSLLGDAMVGATRD